MREQAVEPRGIHLAAHPLAVDVQVVDAGQPRKPHRRPVELGSDGGPGQVPELGEGAALHRPAVADDGNPVAQGLHLGEYVAGEEHGPSASPLLLHAPAEGGLHQGVEARGGLVQEEQLGVGGERRHERHLLAVPLGVGAGLLPRVELEALQKLGATLFVEPSPHAPEEVYYLPAREAGPERHVSGHVGQTPVQGDRIAPGVATEQARLAGVLADQTEQNA